MKANGKITKELKDLGTKINGKAPSGETISELINGIADDYEGGSGTSYTAGTGIEITNENVINNTQNNVVANPTLAGTEDELTGLLIGNTKYKAPESKQLYQHNLTYTSIYVSGSQFMQSNVNFEIITDSNTPFTYSTLIAYLTNILPANDMNTLLPFQTMKGMKANGKTVVNDNGSVVQKGQIQAVMKMSENSGQRITICFYGLDFVENNSIVSNSACFPALEETYTYDNNTYQTITDDVIPFGTTNVALI